MLTNLNARSYISTITRNLCFFSKIYKVPFNINQEEHASYLKKVEKAEKLVTDAQKATLTSLLPRRKRRIYDKPRFDTNIQNYAAWRLYRFDEILTKPNDHCFPVILKIPLQPKWLVHAFGQGMLPYCHKHNVSREFVFQDVNFSQYILYQYRETTCYKPNVPNYDYQNQQHLRPGMRLKKRFDPIDFWKSQQYFDFRVNGTKYAEKMKFKEWILKEVEQRKNQPSYDEKIDKKFGKVHTFNYKHQSQLFVKHEPIIRYVTPALWQPKEQLKEKKKKDKSKQGTSQQQAKKQQPLKPVQHKFPKKLAEQHRVYSVQQTLKSKQQTSNKQLKVQQ